MAVSSSPSDHGLNVEDAANASAPAGATWSPPHSGCPGGYRRTGEYRSPDAPNSPCDNPINYFPTPEVTTGSYAKEDGEGTVTTPAASTATINPPPALTRFPPTERLHTLNIATNFPVTPGTPITSKRRHRFRNHDVRGSSFADNRHLSLHVADNRAASANRGVPGGRRVEQSLPGQADASFQTTS